MLHFNVPLLPQPLAVKVAFSVPQTLTLSVDIVGVVGIGNIVITIGVVAVLLPQLLLQVAVYVPEVVTSMVLVVAPVLQLKLPTHPLAVNIAFCPSQQIVLSLLMIGAFGLLPVVMMILLDTKLVPQLLVHVAV